MSLIRVALCQLDFTVGDLDGNKKRILIALEQAESSGCDVAVFSELAISGYPPEDLVLKPQFVKDNLQVVETVASNSKRCAAIFGFVDESNDPELFRKDQLTSNGKSTLNEHSNDEDEYIELEKDEVKNNKSDQEDFDQHLLPSSLKSLFNASAIVADGSILGRYHKRTLPNYSVFDEERTFTPGSGDIPIFTIAGINTAVVICEDAWIENGPIVQAVNFGAQLIFVINASPYLASRLETRKSVLRDRALESNVPIVYVNQVGGQDELVFDGGSMILDSKGDLISLLPQFEENIQIVDLNISTEQTPLQSKERKISKKVAVSLRGRPNSDFFGGVVSPTLEKDEEIYEALITGTRDYVEKNGFTGVVIGLSGGIDSSLVATIARDALGPDRVLGIAMPSKFSSKSSITDAKELSKNLGIELRISPIEDVQKSFEKLFLKLFGSDISGLAHENLQSRIRGVILMGISNSMSKLVLTTGNKSELAVGYSTLYGDSAGGFAVIKDVFKTDVYRLCQFRNEREVSTNKVALIPKNVLTKAPSAELRPDQRDDQSLPPYEILDPILKQLIDYDKSPSDATLKHYDQSIVNSIARLIDQAEHKRRQNPPGVRISAKAFGKDRRVPITNKYRP